MSDDRMKPIMRGHLHALSRGEHVPDPFLANSSDDLIMSETEARSQSGGWTTGVGSWGSRGCVSMVTGIPVLIIVVLAYGPVLAPARGDHRGRCRCQGTIGDISIYSKSRLFQDCEAGNVGERDMRQREWMSLVGV